MQFRESAAIIECDGECVGIGWKLSDIWIKINKRFINCNPISVTPTQNSMAWIVNEEEHIWFEVYGILGDWEELLFEHLINLFCCLVNQCTAGVLKAFHMVLKEFLYRSHVFVSLREGFWLIQISWGANKQCLRHCWADRCCILHIPKIN